MKLRNNSNHLIIYSKMYLRFITYYLHTYSKERDLNEGKLLNKEDIPLELSRFTQ